LIIPSDATASAKLPKIPSNVSRIAKSNRKLRVTSSSENVLKPMALIAASTGATAPGPSVRSVKFA
jgi:hypothetical protein